MMGLSTSTLPEKNRIESLIVEDHAFFRATLNRLKHHSWFFLLLWTGCIAASLLWNLYEQREKILDIARNSAQITFENDVLYRRWVAKQGGVLNSTPESFTLTTAGM
jgi:hypothetical protein